MMNTEARQRVHVITDKIRALTASYQAMNVSPTDKESTQVDDLVIEAIQLIGWPELADAYKEFFEL